MTSSNAQSRRLSGARRAVVKVGSGVLTAAEGLNLAVVENVSQQISILMDQGVEIILVSSGAMAAGRKKMGFQQRPALLRERQAVAAVGQSGLMHAYEQAFGRFGRRVAQMLLTSDGLSDRKRYLNARNTIYTLLEWDVVPIINENDSVSIEEIQFGDNDHLAAMITLLMDADVLINLSDIDGLFTADPRSQTDARLIPEVTSITPAIEQLAGAIPGELGTGGMQTKIRAAGKLTAAGVPMIIARGSRPNILMDLFRGEPQGTFFLPAPKKLSQRKCWIAYNLQPSGTLTLDAGAIHAVLEQGKSLLPSGIIGVEGDFDHGAAVACVDENGRSLAIGLVNYRSEEIDIIKGLQSDQIESRLGAKSYDEVIHRDNLAILGDQNLAPQDRNGC